MENQNENNKEKPFNNIEYCKKWYKDNHDKHLAYVTEQITCDGCLQKVMRCNLSRHTRSRLHNLLVIQKKYFINMK